MATMGKAAVLRIAHEIKRKATRAALKLARMYLGRSFRNLWYVTTSVKNE
jgi:hypothetical protein